MLMNHPASFVVDHGCMVYGGAKQPDFLVILTKDLPLGGFIGQISQRGHRIYVKLHKKKAKNPLNIQISQKEN